MRILQVFIVNLCEIVGLEMNAFHVEVVSLKNDDFRNLLCTLYRQTTALFDIDMSALCGLF